MKLNSTIQVVALTGALSLAYSSAEAAKMQQTFSYDAAGRLTNVVTDSGSSEISLNEHYQFDASGNITEKVVDGQAVRMTYDAGNQLLTRTDAEGTTHFVYDSAGRLVAERKNGEVIAQYKYGYLDKVTQVTRGAEVTQFHYNARGMLVAKERDGQIIETFGWDGIGLIAKDNTVYANEAHVSGGVPLAAIDASDSTADLQYYDSDYLGTTTAVYSAEGDVDAKLVGSYGAGGESDELRFTGKPYDADLDAHVFPYRNYRADVGRWVSADPAGFPDGPNQHYYACVPTMGLDPLGLLKVSSSISDNYPNAAAAIKAMAPSSSAIEAFKSAIADNTPTTEDITDAFTNDNGPTLNGADLTDANGTYELGTDNITINNSILQAIEDGTAGAELLLESTVGHEVTHWLDNNDGSQMIYESGEAFEMDLYGMDIDSLADALSVAQSFTDEF